MLLLITLYYPIHIGLFYPNIFCDGQRIYCMVMTMMMRGEEGEGDESLEISCTIGIDVNVTASSL